MRRVRAIAMLAVLWGVVWFIVGLPVRALTEALLHAEFEPPPPFLEIPTILMVWGTIAGAAFALFLMAAERRRTLHLLRWSRTALWGALGSLPFPAVIVVREGIQPGSAQWEPILIVCTISALLGAACAAGTLALAKRGQGNT